MPAALRTQGIAQDELQEIKSYFQGIILLTHSSQTLRQEGKNGPKFVSWKNLGGDAEEIIFYVPQNARDKVLLSSKGGR